MSPDELKQAYYELALAEIEHRVASKHPSDKGRPTDWERYRKLAKLLCLDGVTLYEAALIIKTGRNNIYNRKFKFVDCRPRNNLNQGNRLKVSYSKEEKLEILALKESGDELCRSDTRDWSLL